MIERILFPEFRDQLEPTRYPFSDTATLRSFDTAQTIDATTFLDASLYPVGGRVGLYLSFVDVTPRRVTCYLGTGENTRLAWCDFDPLLPPSLLRLVDIYDRPAGVFVSEPLRLARFSTWPVGVHTFPQAATEFAASCVIPTPEIGVRGLLTEKDELLTGDVWLVGDNGVVVRDDAGDIRVDIVGDPLYARKLCGPVDLFEPPLFIRTINHCAPDTRGEFTLIVGNHLTQQTVLRVFPTDDGLRIEAVGSPKRGK